MLTLKNNDLMGAIKFCKASLSSDNSRLVLSGYHLKTNFSDLIIDSCDGITASRKVIKDVEITSDSCYEESSVDITLDLSRVKLTKNGYCTVSVNGNMATITDLTAQTSITLKGISGEYLDLNKIVPATFESEYLFNAKKLSDILSSYGDNVVTLKLNKLTPAQIVAKDESIFSIICPCKNY